VSTNKFDVIVVGAGPAGVAAAFQLARAGVDVAIVERGEFPGSKNMFGGAFYGRVLHELIPNFWEEAPIERVVTKRLLTLMSSRASVAIELNSRRYAQPPYNGFTILRPKFDNWFAQKAVEQGATLIPATTVDSLLYEGKKVAGVRTRREHGDLYANIVIAADGVNSFLARQAGLRKDFSLHHLVVGVKEVLKLPSEVIEERFKLGHQEGMANEFVGGIPVKGGGFLYTNKNTISIGVVAELAALKEKKIQVVQVLEDFKNHPTVKEMIRDGVPVEYGGHLIPEAGFNMMPELYTDGMLVVGDAAGMVFATGLALEGMNYAMAGGIAAAKAALRALRAENYSAGQLSCYKTLLEESFVLRDLKEFRHASSFVQNPRIHDTYAAGVTELMEKLFTSDGQPRQKIMKMAKSQFGSKVSLLDIVKDGWSGGRGLLW
jgi:electron transfer flavoprotein-quinone oxidoreductase